MFLSVMSYSRDRLLFPFSSVASCPGVGIAAASVGHGVFRVDEAGFGHKLDGGLPAEATVNRLRTYGGRLYACTRDGLYVHGQDGWSPTDIAIPSYQLKEFDGVPFAATEYGLWCGDGKGGWYHLAYSGSAVYDFLVTPQSILLGNREGLSWYDRYAGSWAEIGLGASVTSLAAYRGALVGSTDTGELLVGDRRGKLERYRFGGLFVFGVSELRGRAYACTDGGLFELRRLRDRPDLLAVKRGVPVTDVALHGGKLYAATLSRGVLALSRSGAFYA